MKMNKFFMLGLAGLAFAACNNEENLSNQLPEGSGAVTIKIVSPAMTRSVETGTTAESVTVTGPVKITLTANDVDQTIELDKDEWESIGDNEITFWNVTNPTKVTVTMNDGKASYTEDAPIVFKDIAPAAIPVYGETSTITLSTETGSPTNGSAYETGAEEGDENKTFQLYEATVQLAIPVARLEVSGIKHITASHTKDACDYSTLTIAGVYLDNVYATGTGVTYANGAFPCASGTPTDYSYDGVHGTGITAIWKDAATPTDFLTEGGVWPANGQAYCYYFFGADGANNLPKFKIYFDTSTGSNSPLPAPRYAMINKYKTSEGQEITKFEPGHIYRITEAVINDDNIYGDEGGENLYGVTVTVTEAVWDVDDIEAEWK